MGIYIKKYIKFILLNLSSSLNVIKISTLNFKCNINLIRIYTPPNMPNGTFRTELDNIFRNSAVQQLYVATLLTNRLHGDHLNTTNFPTAKCIKENFRNWKV